jgi:hypothetical protein
MGLDRRNDEMMMVKNREKVKPKHPRRSVAACDSLWWWRLDNKRLTAKVSLICTNRIAITDSGGTFFSLSAVSLPCAVMHRLVVVVL